MDLLRGIFGENYETTSLGIVLILFGLVFILVGARMGNVELSALGLPTIITGLAFLRARDNQASQKAVRAIEGDIQQAKGEAVREAEHVAAEVAEKKVETLQK
jgi:di/tricarboxylate transporter